MGEHETLIKVLERIANSLERLEKGVARLKREKTYEEQEDERRRRRYGP